LVHGCTHPNVYVESLASAVRANLQKTGANSAGLDQPLTKRELDILRRLSTGLPISQIAGSLHISNNTIKTHLKNVYRKLKVDSRESAVEKGRELLLI
jgi:LuxR family maltose regulon positive regulatory protein